MNDGLIYSMTTLGIGLIGLIIRYAFKSKCTDVSICCGLINIHRNIEQEIEEEKNEAKMGRNDSLKNLGNI